jgi:hypothetical protein
MLKQFYEKALPKQGVYCVSGIEIDSSGNTKVSNRFTETLDGVYNEIEKLNRKGINAFVALGTFTGYSRKADDSAFFRSFFIDLDVGDGKSYTDKSEAHVALYKLIEDAGLPDPVVVDSGGGFHAYWLMDEDIPTEVWKPYAEKFKALCMSHITIDPVVTADVSRIMRCPETFNYKYDPPRPTSVISDEVFCYSFQEFKDFLGEPELDAVDILAAIPKGLDDDTRAILNRDNFISKFEEIAIKSLEGDGCNQIKHMLLNPNEVARDQWAGGLTIAVKCVDGDTAIHSMSEDYNKYSYDETEKTARSFDGPRTCAWFIENFPTQCEGCSQRGRIITPIQLGRILQIAPDEENSVREVSDSKEVSFFPKDLKPFVRGQNGGIYYLPPPKVDKKGKKFQDDPILILPYDLYPTRRMMSKIDGEVLLLRWKLPKDPEREFLFPMKGLYAKDVFNTIMSGNGVFPEANNIPRVMNYIVKWGQYMQTVKAAEIMRMQMGWSDDISSPEWPTRSFVIGNREIRHTGDIVEAPMSPFVRGIAKMMVPQGTYERWRESAAYLNEPSMELHAFAMLCGFASPLMCYTSTSGVSICLLGLSGNAKTGAMYAGLSAFGNPKDLSVFETTDNGMVGRYLGLHNIMLGIDEISNKDPKILSQLIHKVSHGKAKIRMQGSVNAEREYEMSASLIAMMTSNQSSYGKLESIKANPDGEVARLIEILISKPQLLIDGGGQLGRHIFDAFRYNYGHAGPMFIKEVLRLGDDYIKDSLAKWDNKFVEDFGIDDVAYRFYQNVISACCVAGTILNDCNILSLDVDRIYHAIIHEVITIRDKVVKVNRTDYESVVTDYVHSNMGNMLIMKEGKVSMEPRGALKGRIDSDLGMILLPKTDFKKYLNERQISSREFEHDMRQRNILVDDKKGRLTTGWKTAIQIDPTYLYWFKTEIPSEILGDGS